MQTTGGKPKSGKDFEELMTRIHQSLHEKAIVTPNDKIRDIHSNRSRQIDISIRIKDGPTEFLGIVEVRERSRPVGENYIEEISAKRESVGADAAFVVSASGFCDTAIKKAQALNIRIFTHEEALSADWMQCLQLKEIVQWIQYKDNLAIELLEPSTNHIINPHQSIVDAVQKNVGALIFTTEQGEPKASIAQIVNWVINKNSEIVFRDIQDGSRKRKRILIKNLQFPLFFPDVTGALRKLECLCVEADFWIEILKTPVHLSKYRDAKTGKSLAEVAYTTIEIDGELHKLELIANISGEIGSQVTMRLHKKDPQKIK